MAFSTQDSVAAAQYVCSATADNIRVNLADKSNNATTVAGLSGVISAGAHLISSFTVSDSGVVLVPNGLAGLVEVVLRVPQPTGQKMIKFSVLFTTDDPRPGLGAVTIT